MFEQNVSTFVFLDEIDPATQRYKIKVQIVKLWRGFQKETGSAIEMVLIDEKGTRMHATVEDKLMNKFKSDLKEDQSIVVDTFQLVNNGFEYKTSPHSFKISFFRTTCVTICDDFPIDVPEKYFVDFPKILAGVLDSKTLVDVIGHIVNVGPLEDIMIRGRSTTKLDIELRDTNDARLVCTLWGKYADQVNTYAAEHGSDMIVCVVRFAQIKEFRGNRSISNSYNSTRILLDPQTKVAHEFRSKLSAVELPIVFRDKSDDTPASSSVSLYEEFFVKNVRKSIHEIYTVTEDLVCVTIGTVSAIEDQYRWCYLACGVCSKKVDPYPLKEGHDGPPLFACEECDKDVSDVTPRYRLMLRVADEFADAKFLFFDGLAEKLIGKSAAVLSSEVPKENPTFLPVAISDLLGKRILFKIRISSDNRQTKNTHYVVQKFADNRKMVVEYEAEVSANSSIQEITDASPISCIMPKSVKKRDVGVTTPAMQYSLRKKVKVEKGEGEV